MLINKPIATIQKISGTTLTLVYNDLTCDWVHQLIRCKPYEAETPDPVVSYSVIDGLYTATLEFGNSDVMYFFKKVFIDMPSVFGLKKESS